MKELKISGVIITFTLYSLLLTTYLCGSGASRVIKEPEQLIPIHLKGLPSVVLNVTHETDPLNQETFSSHITESKKSQDIGYIVAKIKNDSKPSFYDAHTLNKYIFSTFSSYQVIGAIPGEEEEEEIVLTDANIHLNYPLFSYDSSGKPTNDPRKYSITWQRGKPHTSNATGIDEYAINLKNPLTNLPIVTDRDIEYYLYSYDSPKLGFQFIGTYEDLISPNWNYTKYYIYATQNENLPLKQQALYGLAQKLENNGLQDKEALNVYTHAARMNADFDIQCKANFALGVMYYFGRGIAIDYKQALHFFDISSRQVGPCNVKDLAKAFLGIMYYHGNGVEVDYATAAKYFNTILAEGRFPNADAQALAATFLGKMYYDGALVAKDFTKAFDLMKKYTDSQAALAQSSPYIIEGHYFLGLMYYFGLGTSQNLLLARKHFESAYTLTEESLRVAEDIELTVASGLWLSYMLILGKGGSQDINRGLDILVELEHKIVLFLTIQKTYNKTFNTNISQKIKELAQLGDALAKKPQTLKDSLPQIEEKWESFLKNLIES